MKSTITDYELVKQALDGKDSAYAILVQRYENFLYRFVYSSVCDARECEELVCDIFVRAWSGLQGYDPKEGSFASWLIWRARSVKSNYFKKRKRQTDLKAQLREASKAADKLNRTTGGAEGKVARKLCVEKVMKGLNQKDRQLAFLLSEYKNSQISLKDISRIRVCSEKTISRHFEKLIKKLQPLMEQCL